MGYDEIMHMPFLLFQYLMISDALCEGYTDQLRHGELLSAIYCASGNIRKQDIDKFSVLNLGDRNGVLSGKTQKELIEERQNKQKQQFLSMFDLGDTSGE